MTTPNALAIAISTAAGDRMGFTGVALERFVANDAPYWALPSVMDRLIEAARAVIEAEDRAERVTPFIHDTPPGYCTVPGGWSGVNAVPLPAYDGPADTIAGGDAG